MGAKIDPKVEYGQIVFKIGGWKMQAKLTQDAARARGIMNMMDCGCVANRQEKTESKATAHQFMAEIGVSQVTVASGSCTEASNNSSTRPQGLFFSKGFFS